MPYIKKEKRPQFEPVIQEMFNAGIGSDQRLSAILLAFCCARVTPSYNNYKNFCGELDQCSVEIVRRVADIMATKKTTPAKDGIADLRSVFEKMRMVGVKADGDLNFILFTYCRRYIAEPVSFCHYLNVAKNIIEVDLLAPYEDEKIKENGDAV